MEENINSRIYKENFDLHYLILNYNICLGYMLKIEKLRLEYYLENTRLVWVAHW